MANEAAAPDATLLTQPDESAPVTPDAAKTAPDAKTAADAATAPVVDDKAAAAVAEKAAAEKLTADIAKLELKLPNGVDAKDLTVAEFKKLAAQSGLDSAKAQSLYDFGQKTIGAAQKAVVDGQAAQMKTAREGWVSSLKADKDFGGSNFEANVALGRRAVAYGGDELKAFLNETGAGDHPAVVKFLAKVGKALGEDTVATQHGDGAAAKTRAKGTVGNDFALLYPNSKELHS